MANVLDLHALLRRSRLTCAINSAGDIGSCFDLAVSTVYRKDKLKVSTDKNAGTPLPPGYHAAAERVAKRRVALASYRLADLLRTDFP